MIARSPLFVPRMITTEIVNVAWCDLPLCLQSYVVGTHGLHLHVRVTSTSPKATTFCKALEFVMLPRSERPIIRLQDSSTTRICIYHAGFVAQNNPHSLSSKIRACSLGGGLTGFGLFSEALKPWERRPIRTWRQRTTVHRHGPTRTPTLSPR